MNHYPALDPIATGKRIKELRRANNIKVDDIVSFMGFESQQAVYKWQRGDSLPSVDNLYALSRLFGTTVDDILVGCDEEEQSSSVHFKPLPIPSLGSAKQTISLVYNMLSLTLLGINHKFRIYP